MRVLLLLLLLSLSATAQTSRFTDCYVIGVSQYHVMEGTTYQYFLLEKTEPVVGPTIQTIQLLGSSYKIYPIVAPFSGKHLADCCVDNQTILGEPVALNFGLIHEQFMRESIVGDYAFLFRKKERTKRMDGHTWRFSKVDLLGCRCTPFQKVDARPDYFVAPLKLLKSQRLTKKEVEAMFTNSNITNNAVFKDFAY